MKHQRLRAILSIIIFCFSSCFYDLFFTRSVYAEFVNAGIKNLNNGIENYEKGKYEYAIVNLNMALSEISKYDKKKLWEAHFYLGLSYYLIEENEESRKEFKKAEEILINKKLDPEIYSPKIVQLYQEIKLEQEIKRKKKELKKKKEQEKERERIRKEEKEKEKKRKREREKEKKSKKKWKKRKNKSNFLAMYGTRNIKESDAEITFLGLNSNLSVLFFEFLNNTYSSNSYDYTINNLIFGVNFENLFDSGEMPTNLLIGVKTGEKRYDSSYVYNSREIFFKFNYGTYKELAISDAFKPFIAGGWSNIIGEKRLLNFDIGYLSGNESHSEFQDYKRSYQNFEMNMDFGLGSNQLRALLGYVSEKENYQDYYIYNGYILKYKSEISETKLGVSYVLSLGDIFKPYIAAWKSDVKIKDIDETDSRYILNFGFLGFGKSNFGFDIKIKTESTKKVKGYNQYTLFLLFP